MFVCVKHSRSVAFYSSGFFGGGRFGRVGLLGGVGFGGGDVRSGVGLSLSHISPAILKRNDNKLNFFLPAIRIIRFSGIS